MNNHDWSSFTRKINIAATKNAILDAWLSQHELEKWFLSKAEFFNGDEVVDRKSQIKTGNTYKWMWHTADVVAEGEVLGLEEEALEFTFVGCKVKVSVQQEAGENILVLTQSEIPTDEEGKISKYLECTRGWTFYMTNLKSVLEGGLDLRNKNEMIKNMLST